MPPEDASHARVGVNAIQRAIWPVERIFHGPNPQTAAGIDTSIVEPVVLTGFDVCQETQRTVCCVATETIELFHEEDVSRRNCQETSNRAEKPLQAIQTADSAAGWAFILPAASNERRPALELRNK
jgi:hypothetical protein